MRSSPASSPRASISKPPSSTRTRKQERSAAQVPVDDDSDDDENLRPIKFKPNITVSLAPKEVLNHSVKRGRRTLRVHSENSSEEESNPVQRKSRRLAIQQNSSEDEGLAVNETQSRKGRILGRKRAISSEKEEEDDIDIVDEVEQDRTHYFSQTTGTWLDEHRRYPQNQTSCS